jgi:endonuclease YncB( thermonuclease family)
MKWWNRWLKWLPLLLVALLFSVALHHPEVKRALESGGGAEWYSVVAVADGDTVTGRSWRTGRTEKIRLCGIDAPEIAHGRKPGQPLGKESRETLRSLLAAGGNEMAVQSVERDRYGRLVGDVFVRVNNPQMPQAERLVNLELVRAGMAYHYTQYSDRCPNGGEDLAAAEQAAQRQRLGVWRGDYQKPWEFRRLSGSSMLMGRLGN